MFLPTLKTVIVIALLFFVIRLLRYGLEKIALVRRLDAERTHFIFKIIKSILFVLTFLVIISIWGMEPENLWLFVGSLMGIVAIGFFAVWSILSNVLAGFFIFFSNVFKLTDTVTVLPDDISGVVIDLKLLFVVLKDENGDIIHVPNNLLVQRIIKKAKPAESAESKGEQEDA